MVFTQKYALISPIESVAEGQVFESNNWPLHVTIADTFAISLLGDDLISELISVVKGHDLKVVGERASRFGENADVDVMLLHPSTELQQLHSDIADLLLNRDAIFNDPQYIKSGFIGHITQQTNRRIGINEEVTLDSVALIDMFPEKNPYKRRVIKIINFDEE